MVNEQPIDEMMRDVLLQLLQTADAYQAAGNSAEAERAYSKVASIAKDERLPDLAARAQSGEQALQRVRKLAEASAALTAQNLETAERVYRAMHENAPGDDEAAQGLAETLFLLGQKDEADERPVAALERYQEAIRLDPSQQPAVERAKVLIAARNRSRLRRLALILLPLVLLATVTGVWAISRFGGGGPGQATPSVVPTAAVVAAQTMLPTAIVTTAPTRTATVTASPTTSPTASALPTRTATMTASPTATASPVRSASPAATSTASPAPTATNAPPPSPTNTRPPAPSATPTVRPSPLPTSPPPLPVITLLTPESGYTAQNTVTFSWRVDRSLPVGYFYEVVAWPDDGKEPEPYSVSGVANALQDTSLDLHLDVRFAQDRAEGNYRWTVLLVTLNPRVIKGTPPKIENSRVIKVPGGYRPPPGR